MAELPVNALTLCNHTPASVGPDALRNSNRDFFEGVAGCASPSSHGQPLAAIVLAIDGTPWLTCGRRP